MVTCRPARDERGQILILTALSMTVLLGIAALSVDASYMYSQRNKLHAAADAAAKIGAAEVHRRPAVTLPALKTFADRQVQLNGFTPAACGSTTAGTTSVCISRPPPLGAPFAGDTRYVEAKVSEVTSTFFARILGVVSANPGARAIAGMSSGPNCVVALAIEAPGIAVSSEGFVTASGCAILDGGDLDNAGTIAAQTIGVSRACIGGCGGVVLNMPLPPDPLAPLLPIPTTAACLGTPPGIDITVPLVSGMPLPPGTYHDITFKSGQLTLAGGLYCVTGAITAFNAGSPVVLRDVEGVTIYLGPSASLTLNADVVDVDLQGQRTGPYKGIVFYQVRGNDTPVLLAKDTGTWKIDGVLYFPFATVDMRKVSFTASNQCGLIVADGVSMNGVTTFANQCASFDGSPILTFSMAE